jgi:hypothetical protein
MTARATAIAELIRTALTAADQLDPVERDAIYAALVADLRSRRPEVLDAPDPARRRALVDVLADLIGGGR